MSKSYIKWNMASQPPTDPDTETVLEIEGTTPMEP